MKRREGEGLQSETGPLKGTAETLQKHQWESRCVEHRAPPANFTVVVNLLRWIPVHRWELLVFQLQRPLGATLQIAALSRDLWVTSFAGVCA